MSIKKERPESEWGQGAEILLSLLVLALVVWFVMSQRGNFIEDELTCEKNGGDKIVKIKNIDRCVKILYDRK